MPSFTFSKGTKQVPIEKQQTPMYDTLQNWKRQSRLKSAPSIAIAKAERDSKQKNDVPGPGSYTTIMNLKKNNGVSFKGTHYVKMHIDGPGPWAYNPHSNFTSKQFSFSKSVITIENVIGPGPTAYNLPAQKNLSIKFPKGQRQGPNDPQKSTVPGPGHYKSMEIQSAEYSFTKEDRSKQQKIFMIPGPGTYHVQKARLLYRGNKFATALREAGKSIVPGPGEYQVNLHPSTPGGCITKSLRQFNYYNKEVPGPGHYTSPSVELIKSKHPSIVLGKEKKFEDSCTITPGPGAYALKKMVFREKSFSFSQSKRSFEKIEKGPGPQTYEKERNNQSSTGVVIGKEKKFLKRLQKTPGPGSYQAMFAKTANSFSFRKGDNYDKIAFINQCQRTNTEKQISFD